MITDPSLKNVEFSVKKHQLSSKIYKNILILKGKNIYTQKDKVIRANDRR